ncbi:sensor histidine kinase [Agrococcus carbonis]|uniref:histidine kinase n=1 Tax=Agrococcus carbonis TaxID=684552 RepID=A0A1H1T3W9_9MICO|nr:HAMP domain-containing sensor histidine kinase [Agrococcus carbonis]SDS54813.1 Signal transduction histidine kinase [Agrococcus carbonis]
MSDDADRRRVRAAALRVGAWVGAASAATIVVGVAILLGVLSATARAERDEPPWGDALVVDVDDVVPVVVLLGVLGVLLVAGIAALAARRAAAPLGEALRAQRTFVADASHELRTPLTALSTRIQLIQRRHARGEPFEAELARLRADADAMDDVLTDLLLAAEDAAAPDRSASVAAAMHEAEALLAPLAERRGIALDVRVHAPVAARVAPATLVRMLVALLDNALQHAPEGSAVTVTADADGGQVALRVADHGAGIPVAEHERIFERFASAEGEGRRRGFGIGLALVRQASERAGGSVRIERSSPAGTVMLLRLPRA